METNGHDTQKADREFLDMHLRATKICSVMSEAAAARNASVGDIALGCLYLIKFYAQNNPGVLLIARRAMALMAELEDKHERTEKPVNPD